MIRVLAASGATSAALAALVLALAGCAEDGSAGRRVVGDLDAIRGHGKLRVVLPPTTARMLPRRGDTLDSDIRLASELAGELGLELEQRVVEDRAALLASLTEGRADLAIARLTVTPERRQRFAFSVPLGFDREVLVLNAGAPPVERVEELVGLPIAVRASSSFYETLVRLRSSRLPELRVVTVDERVDTEDLLYRVGRGDLAATVADEGLARQVMAYRDDLRIAFPLTAERPIAWAMRKNAPQLKAAVDDFLHRRAVTTDAEEVALGDLDRIKERRVLRVLTRNNAASYFLHRGRQVGFEFELARRFARSIGCRLQVVVPPGAEQLIPWLEQGRGDLIAANLTITPDRAERVAFSRPYNFAEEMLVVRSDDPIQGPDDLAGRRVTVRPSSSYFGSLVALQRSVEFQLVAADESIETEQLIADVAEGREDTTVADNHILNIELAQRDDVRAAFALGEARPIGWAVRPEDTELLEAVDAFLDKIYRGEFFNVLASRYFHDPRRVARLAAERTARTGKISPYDELFRASAEEVELDWRLLAATAQAESGFRPATESFAGAVGLMQVLPHTAREVGVEGDLRDPELNIRAGSRYLRRLIDLLEGDIPPPDRLRFALAAYNAGRGHLLDGRRLAREEGLNPNRWAGNVEQALALLTRAEFARRAAYGYCRCRQTLAYVRKVIDTYGAYVRLVD